MDRILRVIDYIHAHADQDLSLDQLADIAAMSRFHWHRVFSAVLGASPAAVIRSIRMNKASVLLVNTDLPLDEVAAQVGYRNPRSFGRVFKENFAATPAAFRKAGRAERSNIFKQGETKMYGVTIRTAEPLHLAALSHKGAYDDIGQVFQKLATMMATGGHWPNVRGMAGVYYDDPSTTACDELRSHAAVIWAGGDVPDGLERVTMEGGRFAVLQLKGPYTGLAAAYQHLYGPWLANAQAELRDAPSFEVYLNDPTEVAPADLLTDVYMPLA